MSAVTTRHALAKIIWEASRADEGTISATGANIVADALLASGAVVDVATLADDEALIEAARKAVEDELIEWRDSMRFMVCGNGFSICEKDGEPSAIIRFRTDVGLRIGFRALAAVLAERA